MSRTFLGVTATQTAVMEAANHLENSAMETRDHFNGDSLKDHRSRGNLLMFFVLFGIFFSTPIFVSAQASTAQQKSFRVDCNYISIYNPITKEWSEWKKGENTFVFNTNLIYLHFNGAGTAIFD